MKNKFNKELDGLISDMKMQIAEVNERSELLKTLTDSLQELFNFTSIFIQSVDHHTGTYYPFLVDPISNARSLSEFRALTNARAPLSDSIVVNAITATKSFIVTLEELEEALKLPFWIETNYRYGARQVLVTPLHIKKEIVGICYIWSDNYDSLTESFAEIMDALSNEIGYAISNLIINEVQNQQQIINDRMLSFSNTLVEVKNRFDLRNAINYGLKDLLHFDAFVIINMIAEKDDYSIFISSSQLQIGQRKMVDLNSFNRRIYELVTESPTPAVIDIQRFDLSSSPEWVKNYYQAGAREMMVKLLPVSDRNQFGLVLLSNKKNMFEASDRVVLQRISNHLTTSISNILANEEVTCKEKDRSFLLSFSHEMATVRNLEELSNAISRGVGKLSEITRYSIRLINEDQQTMSIYIYDDEIKRAIEDGHPEVLTAKHPIKDGVQDLILAGDGPMDFNLMEWLKTDKAPSYFHLWKSLGINEAVGTPLRTGCTNHGILWVDTTELNIELLDGICTQVSIAISNVKANEELLRREKDKEILLAFSHDIASVRNKDDLRNAIEKVSIQLSSIARFVIRGINEDQQSLSLYIYDSHVKQAIEELGHHFVLDAIYPLNDGVSDVVLAGNETIVYELQDWIDAGKAPSYFHFWRSMNVQKCIATPLKTGDSNLGIFWVDSEYPDVEMIDSICAQISIAMSNIKANEELIRREKDKEILLAFSHDIASVRDKDGLRKAIEKVSNQLSNIARFLIRGVNDDQETMTIYLYDDKVKKDVEETGQQFILSAVFPLKDGISEVVLEGNETKVFELQEYIDAGKASSCIHFWRSLGAQKCVATPLKTGGRKLGIFWVDAEYPDVKMIDSICAQISIAMSNILANEELLKFKQRLEVENAHLQEQIRQIYNSSEIIGTSDTMQEVYQLMSLVAHSNATVLIQGETGTGKELIARGIHDSSHRKNQIMVKVNCAALPLSLIESELFGYEKGAFTGAYEKRIGKFELAHRGTLFLDEIGELPLEVQVKLLRVLQEREFERLGGKLTIKVDVRIIAATNRDLKAEVSAGRFRSDLYYRLNVFPIQLPPLRDRREDISCLAHFFLARYSKNHLGKISGISVGAMNELKAYSWPGNVRELEHMIERSVLLSDTKTLTKVYLPDSGAHDHTESVDIIDLESIEKQHIIEVLRRCNGKISGKGGAAELLRLPSSTLNSKMKKLGITAKTALI